MLIYNQAPYRLLQFTCDLLALTAAWHLTFAVRLGANSLMPIQLEPWQLATAAPPLAGVLLLWMLAAVSLGAYRRANDSGAHLVRLTESAVFAGLLLIVVTFFSRQFGAQLSRSFVLLFAPLSFLLLTLARYMVLLASDYAGRRWSSPENVAVIGAGQPARQMVERLGDAGRAAARVAGVVLPRGASLQQAAMPVPLLGTTAQLGELINREQLNRLVIVNGCLSEPEVEECSRISKRMGVTLNRTLGDAAGEARLAFTSLCGMPLLELRPVSFSRSQEWIKRGCDLVLSATLLAILAPGMLLAAALIKLTSHGPVFFRSPRVGKGGRHFSFLKFRSMYTGRESRHGLEASNERGGHIFKVRHDPRITPVGRWLRRFSIDELPQLINVVRGQMSLIGPRPLPAQDLSLDGSSRQFAAWAEQRARVLPGITGLWQVRGRSDLSFEEMVELDFHYLRNWSLLLDARILVETPLAVLSGRGAY